MPHAEEALEVQKASQTALSFLKKLLCIENQSFVWKISTHICTVTSYSDSTALSCTPQALLSPNTEETQRLEGNTLLLCQRVVVKKTYLGCVGHTGICVTRHWPGCDAENFLMYLSVNTEPPAHVTEATRHAPSSELTSLDWVKNSVNMYFSLLDSSHGDFIYL